MKQPASKCLRNGSAPISIANVGLAEAPISIHGCSFVFISDLVKGVRVIWGFEKKNLVKLIWWAQEHVCVTCDSIPSILTGFWHQGVTVVQF
jgi:hypothetical protein